MVSDSTASHQTEARAFALAAAVSLPTLIAYNIAPATTLYNQLAAVALFGFVLLLSQVASQPAPSAGSRAVGAALALWGLAIAICAWREPALLGAAILILATLGATWMVFKLALGADRALAGGLAWGLLLAGLAGVLIGLLQVFRPEWTNGTWIARTGFVGRAVGNLRQPNHLATLLLWAAVAAVWLEERQPRPRPHRLLPLLMLMVGGVVLSASRTGLYFGVPLLMAWGLLDRSLSRTARWALLATPLMALLAWGALHLWAEASGGVFGAEARLDSEGAGSPSRLKILANTWELMKQHPWTGVGAGEFNRAWTLSEFPNRPIAFFDHCHNLPLQLLVELGWPLGLTVLLLLGWGFLHAAIGAWRAQGPQAIERRAPLLLLLIVFVHSMLEYPLWYAHFLLPTAFAWGLCLAPEREVRATTRTAWRTPLVGAFLILASLFALMEYQKVAAIYAPPRDRLPLVERIAIGQRTLLFSAQADYAAATALGPDAASLEAARRTGHHLIDARLLIAWAKSLAAVGEIDKARYVVARLREFRSAEGKAWLASCDDDATLWFCAPAQKSYTWKDF